MIPVVVFFAFFSLCFVAIICVIISILKRGDERVEMIIQKTSTNTFCIMLFYLVINICEQLLNVLKGNEIKGVNPFVQMSVLSFIYLVQLLYYKRKYRS